MAGETFLDAIRWNDADDGNGRGFARHVVASHIRDHMPAGGSIRNDAAGNSAAAVKPGRNPSLFCLGFLLVSLFLATTFSFSIRAIGFLKPRFHFVSVLAERWTRNEKRRKARQSEADRKEKSPKKQSDHHDKRQDEAPTQADVVPVRKAGAGATVEAPNGRFFESETGKISQRRHGPARIPNSLRHPFSTRRRLRSRSTKKNSVQRARLIEEKTAGIRSGRHGPADSSRPGRDDF